MRGLTEVEALLKQGAMVELEPSPITEPLLQHYQTLSGRLPEHFGFFDTLVPRNYAVVEESSGRGVTPKLLPDLLRTVGWTVRYEEVSLADLAAPVQAWTTAIPASPACLIVKGTERRRVAGNDIAQTLRLRQASIVHRGF